MGGRHGKVPLIDIVFKFLINVTHVRLVVTR